MPNWTDENIDFYAEKYGDHPSVFAVVAAIPFGGAEDVLDIGCGTGSALRAMAERTSGALVGVDPFERMLDHARALTAEDRVRYLVGTAGDLPAGDASFDVVTAINSVPHWDDVDAGYAELLRVLRPGGLLVIGGEGFTEPEMVQGRPYLDQLTADGFDVHRVALDGDCFAVTARRSGP